MKSPFTMNARERRELALSKIILVALAVLGLAAIIWLAWFMPQQEGKPATEQGKSSDNSASSSQSTPAEEKKDTTAKAPAVASYLVISEWGIRIPLTSQTSDLVHVFHTDATGERASFTYTRLKNAGYCTTDVGVSLSRSTAENQPPFSIENPEPVAHIGDYFYYIAYGGSPCYDDTDTKQMEIVNSIHSGSDIKIPIRDQIRKAEALD